jgi:hypothetical protein
MYSYHKYHGDVDSFLPIVVVAGYPYFEWNGGVYETAAGYNGRPKYRVDAKQRIYRVKGEA